MQYFTKFKCDTCRFKNKLKLHKSPLTAVHSKEKRKTISHLKDTGMRCKFSGIKFFKGSKMSRSEISSTVIKDTSHKLVNDKDCGFCKILPLFENVTHACYIRLTLGHVKSCTLCQTPDQNKASLYCNIR